jgi:phage shock protein E
MQKLYIFLLISLFSCTGQTQDILDAKQTEALLATDSTIQLIDVRTPTEWAQTGVIEGALRIDFNSPDFQENASKLDRKKTVITYCAAGGRSPRAAALLRKMGFEKVLDYTGGMNDWKAKGKKTIR